MRPREVFALGANSFLVIPTRGMKGPDRGRGRRRVRGRLSGGHPHHSGCAKDAKLAVNVLLIDPSSNKVLEVTGLRVFFEAAPLLYVYGPPLTDAATAILGYRTCPLPE